MSKPSGDETTYYLRRKVYPRTDPKLSSRATLVLVDEGDGWYLEVGEWTSVAVARRATRYLNVIEQVGEQNV